MPKDIYLLMRPELIRATLKGQKWQTRRVVKPSVASSVLGNGNGRKPTDWQAANYFRRFHNAFGPSEKWWSAYHGDGSGPPKDGCMGHLTSPYGKPGDLAVVREAVGCNDEYPVQKSMQLHRTGAGLPNGPLVPQQLEFWQKYVVYRASTPEPPYLVNGWRSPLHMPRWAARIVRPITEIRIERVAEISEEDAIAEGCDWGPSRPSYNRWGEIDELLEGDSPQLVYRHLWNEINAKPKPRYGREGGKKVITRYEAFPWSAEDFDAMFSGARESGAWKGKPLHVYVNPWVWVISFEREEATHA